MLSVEGLSVEVGGHPAVRELSLRVGDGETVAVLGPTGAGKTTLLRVIAGLQAARQGRVRLGPQVVTDGAELPVAAADRGIGLVPQDVALWPHLDVNGNVAAPLRGRVARSEIGRRVAETRKLVGIENLGRRRPAELSGGEQQLVALARALAPEPSLLLLDEPLSNLDPTSRERVTERLLELRARRPTTTLMVTHDRDDAFAIADRVAIVRAGQVEQIGRPEELYREPRSPFVAAFSGTATLLGGVVEAAGRIRCSLGAVPGRTEGLAPGARVTAVVRPEDVTSAPDGPIQGIVARSRFRSGRYLCEARVGAAIALRYLADEASEPGMPIRLLIRRPAWLVPAADPLVPDAGVSPQSVDP